MSRQFAKAMKQLKIRHGVSSAYHPETQGALERFHQTLQSLLRTYCVELGRDWEEGLPWLMLSVREVSQESTGFSPNELVFGHEVCGPVAVVAGKWRETDPPGNVIDYVDGFRFRLYQAWAAAQRGLKGAQSKMKRLFDRKAKVREFEPGSQVLALLPVEHNSLQAKFMGPYEVHQKLSDVNYLIKTPDRRKGIQLCHINLLKPYYKRVPEVKSPPDGHPLVGPEFTGVSVSPVCHFVESSTNRSSARKEEGDVQSPGEGVMRGRLENSAYLKTLNTQFNSSEQREDLIKTYDNLFPDVPTRTHLIMHDIEVVDPTPIKQRFYRVPVPKRQYLKLEIEYMLNNGIAKPTFSNWSSPCLLV